jgi:hypothetical protein
LATKMPIDGAVLLAGNVFPVAVTVTAATSAKAASHPKMNPAPLFKSVGGRDDQDKDGERHRVQRHRQTNENEVDDHGTTCSA